MTAPDLADRLLCELRWLHLLCFHLAGRRIRARFEVDDLVQDVCLRALGAAGAPAAEAGEQPLRRWLARIARQCVIDTARALRSKKRSAREERLDRSASSAGGAAQRQLLERTMGPATRAAARDEVAHLLRRFERLPADYRRVLALRQFEGLTAAATARRMARSEAAIHSLYRRALQAWAGD
ncbi:MAG: sigma-70 family RNA polymerase sigma factor [Planctomycetota bacterium]